MEADLGADVVVVGAGVVGLAVARALARTGREVVILESESALGRHTSGRNSGVIHAGMHHEKETLRARLCVLGRQALYEYCEEHQVPHQRTGKIVVAPGRDEVKGLEAMLLRGRANGVTDLVLVDGDEARRLEPALRCTAALLSPSTGIVDPESLLRSLRREVEDAGVRIAFGSPVLGGEARTDGVILKVGGADPVTVSCHEVVNAAGLGAQGVARSLSGFPGSTVPPLYLARGHYFVLSGASPFRQLVYPLPVAGGLGIHLTLDLAGAARFGPDVSFVDRVDYRFEDTRLSQFETSIRRYWPGLPDGALSPGFVGIRPRLSPPGAPPADFAVHGPEVHGVNGLICLYGIESPGLTASLALADLVRARLDSRSSH